MKEIKDYIKRSLKKIPLQLVGIFIAIFIVFLPLICDPKVAYGHDSYFHITNMMAGKSNINIFNLDLFVPKIFMGLVANGFGYGTGIFYPPLSYHLTTYFGILVSIYNISPIYSITVVELLVVMCSGIAMYLFINDVFKDKNIASIGSISYVTSTYILCDIYIRTALAELLTFLFIPIVFWGLYNLFFDDGKKFRLLFILGYTGMIFSHLVLTIYLTLLILLIFIIFWKKTFKFDKLKKLITSSIIILLITSPFTVPLLEHKFLGNYVVFSKDAMYTTQGIVGDALRIDDFFKIGSTNFGLKVFLNHIVLIAFLIIVLFNKRFFKNKERNIFYVSLTLIIISCFISSEYFPWARSFSFLKMIQFPWRLMIFINFGISFLVGNIVKIIKGENKNIMLVLLAFSIVFFSYNQINREKIRSNLSEYYTDLGAQKEYLPVNTKKNMHYFNNRNNLVAITTGKADITSIPKKDAVLKANISTKENKVVLELPLLYYLGYQIKFTNKNNIQKVLEYKENNNGFIEVTVTESGLLEVYYNGTTGGNIANAISLLTIIEIVIIKMFKLKKRKKI